MLGFLVAIGLPMRTAVVRTTNGMFYKIYSGGERGKLICAHLVRERGGLEFQNVEAGHDSSNILCQGAVCRLSLHGCLDVQILHGGLHCI